ncbi:MAG TPA: amino acid permease [Cyanobacteria bacterium UBA11149]|nr:amino acid permease [Cyanobacteria bacterium UBA11367]HBE59040.1 amino acid permease [Cyanobacteria bacterium UBA11366]HBK63076.1 amino acid permease [Cyanobacteria bacterium UBA11166]HBR74521.1 amino acid permease [Cyanobacteria bacterium UBA11159]HBS72026.1 amino acid permease [Cyanobacteria bacterium UBA11153]HBW90340.1 amino acid permease [Cyanobacteria bacterium UBA11149]HCA94850.1 amino acid permease [Cyanobacteria bacterium UBA9226]
MKTRLFAKKSIESLLQQAEDSTSHGLERTLNVFNLTALGVGGIIGAGIFVLTGQVAANYTGPAIALSFLVAAICCGFVGLCYAEFASMIPIAGSGYTYAYATLGEIVAWMIGWVLLLEYVFCCATVAVGWSGYITSFLKDIGIVIPPYLLSGTFNVPAIFIIAIITILLLLGIRKSSGVNNGIVAVKLGVIFLFILVGISYINQENLLPFIPENTGEFGKFGLSGIWRGAGAIFFAYIGFDGITSVAQEAKNPQRDMPIAILASLLVSTILYISVALVLVGIVPYQQLNVADPMAVGVDALGEELVWLQFAIKIGAIAGLSSVILVNMMAQARIFYAIANDGLLPPQFAEIHPEFKTPHLATIVSGIVAAILAGLFPIDILGELASFGALLAFFVIAIAVLVLRHTQPDLARPFKTPFVPFVPIIGALTSGLQMLTFPLHTWLQLLGWLLIGLLVYFTYSRHNSLLNMAKG